MAETNGDEIFAFMERMETVCRKMGGDAALARRSGIGAQLIGRYRTGKTEPTRTKLIAIAEAADVPVEWLVSGVEPGQRKSLDRDMLEETAEDLFAVLGDDQIVLPPRTLARFLCLLYLYYQAVDDAEKRVEYTKQLIES